MEKPQFDENFARVSRDNYVTGKAALNFPHFGKTTGGWHFLSYFDLETGVAKVSLAGVHYPDTTAFFGKTGIFDVTDRFAERGWELEGKRLFMADHYRAAGDMIIKWTLSDSDYCNVEISDWFPTHAERQKLFALLNLGKQRLSELGRQQRLEVWLSSQ